MSDGLDVGAWKEDLAFLRDIILREHPNPFTRVPRRRFEEAVDRVGRRIPVLAKHEVIIEFARLLAMIRDGHSGFSLREVPGFRSFPLHFYLFSDGLFVTAPPPGMG